MHKSGWGLVPLLLLSSCPLTIVAQDVAVGEFEPLVVTATRTAETADETLASVTVITREEIEREQARSLPDLLRGVPGIALANNGGAGKATSLYLRGTESDHLLVLVDGVRVGSATTGTASLQYIPVEQIERIEIVRGPRSSLYGSEAIGGVIQIFTRKGGGKIRPVFQAGVGSYGSYEGYAGVAGGGERGWFNLGVSTEGTEGFDACEGNLSAGCYADEPDDDGYRNVSVSLRGGHRWSNTLELEVHALHIDADSDYDGGFSNEVKSIQQVAGLTVKGVVRENWRVSLSGGSSRDDSKNYKDGAFVSRFTTDRDAFSLQNDIEMGQNHQLTLGGDYWDDRVTGTTDYQVSSRDNKGWFLQYQGRFGAHDVQLRLREDDNEQFGRKGTGDVAWGYAFHRNLRVTASYGTAFKAPTFNELYYPGYGNPDLQPEESRSFELGLAGDGRWGDWRLSLYETVIDELIAYDAATFSPANLDEARIRGLEGVLKAEMDHWMLTASFTLLDPENRSTGPDRGNVLPRRAEQTLRLDADRAFGRYRFGATLFAVGRRYDDLRNTRELDAYATVDLRAEYAFGGAWLFQARIENLLDETYQTAAFYNQPGRGVYLTVRYRP